MEPNENTDELIPDTQLARLLSISRSMVHKLRSTGRLPEPVRLGRCLRWRSAQIREWIAAGCPNPQTWEGRDRA